MNAQDIQHLFSEFTARSTEAGLLVFDGLPVLPDASPSVFWGGAWEGYIELARRAGTRIVYVYAPRYDPRSIIDEAVEDQIDAAPISDDEDEADDELPPDGGAAWIRAELHEALTPFDSHAGETKSVNAVWFRDGVAHVFRAEAGWLPEAEEAVERCHAAMRDVEPGDRTVRSVETARKLHEYADRVARHPRFPEANSQEKREFMVGQLFPEIAETGGRWAEYHLGTVARRASLIYWWEVEPVERVAIAERVRAMKKQGESNRTIAAVLKISDARVKQALDDDPSA